MTERPALSAGYLAWFDYAEKMERELLQAEQRAREFEQLARDADEETMMYYRLWCEATGRDPKEPRPALAVPEPAPPEPCRWQGEVVVHAQGCPLAVPAPEPPPEEQG